MHFGEIHEVLGRRLVLGQPLEIVEKQFDGRDVEALEEVGRRLVRLSLARIQIDEPPDGVPVGPLFVPFFIVPTLEWIFWGWLKAFIQYSFMLVIANAFIFVFEQFLSRFLQTLPPGLRLEEQLLYSVHAVMILVTFTVGVLLVPSLTSSIFSGRSGESDIAVQARH